MEQQIMKKEQMLRNLVLVLLAAFLGSAQLTAQCIANAGPDRNVCEDACVTLGLDSAQSGLIYQWNGLNGTPTSPLDSNSVAQPEFCAPQFAGTTAEYQFIVLDPIQLCSDTDTIVLTVQPTFVVNRGWIDSTICLGDTLRPIVTPLPADNYGFQWIAPAGNTVIGANLQDPLLEPNSSGVWNVTVTNLNTTCVVGTSVNITVEQLQVVVDPASSLINPGQRVQLNTDVLNGVAPYSYTWTPETFLSCTNCADPVAHAMESTSYTVSVEDADGCQGTATAVITTDSLLIPNVFTPNNDGINDVLFINYYGENTVYEILIYDRWGRKVFENRDRTIMWDGTDLNAQALPTGVYYMYVRIVGDPAIPEKDKQRAFAVNLIR